MRERWTKMDSEREKDKKKSGEGFT